MSRDFDDILNDCLERAARGEGLQQCMESYPEYREELAPLLGVANVTMQAAASATYGPQVKAHGLSRLTQALTNRETAKKSRFGFLWRPVARPIALGFIAVLLTSIAAGGTTMASSSSTPGDPLYWVKTTKESISLRMPRSNESKAQMHAQLASVRGEEMRKLVARGNVQSAQVLVMQIQHHLNQSAAYSGIVIVIDPIEMPANPRRIRQARRMAELKALLEHDGRMLRSHLSELLKNAPPEKQRRIKQIIRKSDLWYRILIEAMNDDPQLRLFWRVEPVNSGAQ